MKLQKQVTLRCHNVVCIYHKHQGSDASKNEIFLNLIGIFVFDVEIVIKMWLMDWNQFRDCCVLINDEYSLNYLVIWLLHE